MSDIKSILQESQHPLFSRESMFSKEFPSDYRQIRYFTLMIVQKAPPEIKEINLLEQQISEIIKNAVKHGNHSDPQKKIRVWYSFSTEEARLIVEDEGDGFTAIDEWNAFNKERLACLAQEDYIKLADYVSYRTEKSDDNDGGNAMFAAVEYWNEGVVFDDKGSCVAVGKRFPKKRPGIELS
ncbi:MAG: ATP-binding protein [Spirochaetales bacterium]|nr:ATP-binding protein [Spirochaetales bacterium]